MRVPRPQPVGNRIRMALVEVAELARGAALAKPLVEEGEADARVRRDLLLLYVGEPTDLQILAARLEAFILILSIQSFPLFTQYSKLTHKFFLRGAVGTSALAK